MTLQHDPGASSADAPDAPARAAEPLPPAPGRAAAVPDGFPVDAFQEDPENVVVTAPAGSLRGRRRADGTITFFGIPFAEAPVGMLRFQPPMPRARWSGIREARFHGATPLRAELPGTFIPEPAIPGDDVLNVDVFTPSTDPAAALPVLVFFHGGGFTAGSPASPWYDGGAFNRDGVVTVNVSYRLGLDGFGWIEDAPANRAVLDWLLALEWVQGNIRAFGGDPSRVTIAGQSAGAAAVLTLLGMPRARGLFRAAWSMSGLDAGVAPERAERIGRALAALGGVEPTVAGFSSLSPERIAKLETEAAAGGLKPTAATRELLDDGPGFAPTIDGDLIPHGILEAARRGLGAGIPLVLTATDDEFAKLFDAHRGALRFLPKSWMLRRLGIPRRRRRDWVADNAGLRGGTAGWAGRYVSDRVFRAFALELAEVRGPAKTWLARFAWRSRAQRKRAVHCSDLPFFFDRLAADGVAAALGPNPPTMLAGALHADAVAFVHQLDPGWPKYSPRNAEVEVFDAPLPETVHDGFGSVRALT
ncbi:carboxylesterase/lipase family protein [Agromyces seonyuensis]|uniref:Carboxylic ester hydrolase n=1 Tax=Agromyces seonyuensis TaxID=2662446 RepID=A0A6I4P3X9_9MICO|nr:carboxylesterase family protein [Agromyces seonyuensis]MWB97964.1 carboxylesterase family protein [Agromyces seonyuensis]